MIWIYGCVCVSCGLSLCLVLVSFVFGGCDCGLGVWFALRGLVGILCLCFDVCYYVCLRLVAVIGVWFVVFGVFVLSLCWGDWWGGGVVPHFASWLGCEWFGVVCWMCRLLWLVFVVSGVLRFGLWWGY